MLKALLQSLADFIGNWLLHTDNPFRQALIAEFEKAYQFTQLTNRRIDGVINYMTQNEQRITKAAQVIAASASVFASAVEGLKAKNSEKDSLIEQLRQQLADAQGIPVPEPSPAEDIADELQELEGAVAGLQGAANNLVSALGIQGSQGATPLQNENVGAGPTEGVPPQPIELAGTSGATNPSPEEVATEQQGQQSDSNLPSENSPSASEIIRQENSSTAGEDAEEEGDRTTSSPGQQASGDQTTNEGGPIISETSETAQSETSQVAAPSEENVPFPNPDMQTAETRVPLATEEAQTQAETVQTGDSQTDRTLTENAEEDEPFI